MMHLKKSSRVDCRKLDFFCYIPDLTFGMLAFCPPLNHYMYQNTGIWGLRNVQVFYFFRSDSLNSLLQLDNPEVMK